MTEIESIYKEYFTDVYLFVSSISHSDSVAEEITSETFFKAMKSLDGFKGNCSLRVWLCEIAKNTYISYMKRQSKTISLNLDAIPESSSFESELADSDLSNSVHKCLHSLEEPFREVFALRVFAELPFKQIGALFGKTDNWACVTYHRAKSKIQKLMEENK